MANLQSPQHLMDYAFKTLGAPILNIEVTEEQALNKIDDAIELFIEYHYAGYEEVFIKYEMTQEDEDRQYIILPDSVVAVLELMEPDNRYSGYNHFEPLNDFRYMFFQNSYWNFANMSMLNYYLFKGKLAQMDYMLNITRTFEFNNVSHRLIPNSRINVNDYNIEIVDINTSPAYIELSGVKWGYPIEKGDTVWIEESTNNDGTYTVDKVEQLTSGDKTRVYLTSSPAPSLTESPVDGHLHIKEGNFIVIHAYQNLDKSKDVDIFNHRLVKSLSIAMIKLQWGNNLKKFEGIEMLGGVTYSGQQIYNEAKEEVDALTEEIKGFEEPPHFFMG